MYRLRGKATLVKAVTLLEYSSYILLVLGINYKINPAIANNKRSLKEKMKLSGVLFALSLPIAALSADVFKIIDDPAATTGTAPQAINSLGLITGSYNPNTGAHGFLLQNGKFTTIDYPGFLQTLPRGINNEGDIVGQVDNGPINQAVKPTSGFIREENGTFQKVDYPGATITGLFGINDREQIVGDYQNDAGTISFGFLLDHGKYTAITPPGALFVVATGVNNWGDTVGFFIDSSGSPQGFHRTAYGAYKVINVPGATDTRARGINDLGEITGQFTDSVGPHAFRLSWGVFTTIDAPNSVATFGRGINDFSVIVGNYNDNTTAHAIHGFIATR